MSINGQTVVLLGSRGQYPETLEAVGEAMVWGAASTAVALLNSAGDPGGKPLVYSSDSAYGLRLPDRDTGTYPTESQAGSVQYYQGANPGESLFYFGDNPGAVAVLYIPPGSGVIEVGIPNSRVVKEGDESSASTTFANIFSVDLAVGAYAFEALLYFTADAAGGTKVRVTSDSTGDFSQVFYVADARNASGTAVYYNIRSAFSSETNTGETTLVLTIRGSVVLSSATNLKIDFAKNVAAGGNTVFKGGSYFQLLESV